MNLNNRPLPKSKLPTKDVLVAMLLMAGLWFGWSHYAINRQALNNRAEELKQCETDLSEIKKLWLMPEQVTDGSHSILELNRVVEELAAKANIQPDQIASVEPQLPAREGESAYLKYPTVVKLDDVSLLQVAKLSSQLRGKKASMGKVHVTNVLLDAPYQRTDTNSTEEPWLSLIHI